VSRAGRVSRADGGGPARRAVVRWAWRMFRREWRQQLLVLLLLTAAVAAAVAGVTGAAAWLVSPGVQTFGTARHLVTLPGSDPRLAADVGAVRAHFRRSVVIENQVIAIPGSVDTMDLRAQYPRGGYGAPLLALVAGRYPAGPGQAALTPSAAAELGLRIGSDWVQGGTARRVTGLVQDPADLLDQFALVVPGQVPAPGQVTILFDATAARLAAFPFPAGAVSQSPGSAPGGSPAAGTSVELVVTLDTLGLLFIGLIAAAGFTVLAQRRLRAIGMLGALGAADRSIRLALLANGALVGIAAALAGGAAAVAGWAALAPRLQPLAEHVLDRFRFPWPVIVAELALAVATAVIAAWLPARAAARLPVVVALTLRPARPRAARRLSVLGVGLLAAGLGALVFADDNGGVPPLLVVGIAGTGLGVALIGPPVISALAAAARMAPVAIRLALRDLARYQARSGAALAAVSLAAGFSAVFVLAVTQAAAQDAQAAPAGPNLPASQLVFYISPAGSALLAPVPGAGRLRTLAASARALAAQLHATSVVALDAAADVTPAALLPSYARADGLTAGYQPAGLVRRVPSCPPPATEFAGLAYVATPALLAHYGISPGQVRAGTDVLTSRAGPAGLRVASAASPDCGYDSGTRYLTRPVIQADPRLPAGTSDPGTLLTARAMRALGLRPVPAGWLIQAPGPLTAAQVSAARVAAVQVGGSVETRSAGLATATLRDWGTAAGLLLALGVLAMTTGLIRGEAAGDLRTLAAAGASGRVRRGITAATAGALALVGALLGTATGYLAIIAWHRSDLGSLLPVPVASLAVTVVGLPLAAWAGGWLLAGREPAVIARTPVA
jgi:putative ABC transport system permease protein